MAGAAELLVAAASDLNFAMKDLVSVYEESTDQKVKVSLGSSGNFFAQIQNGAPFDLYFSADIAYPKKLQRLAVPDSLLSLCSRSNRVVDPGSSPLDLSKGLDAPKDPGVKEGGDCQS
ncbi:MAG: substrate-binding domain-containing protein [Nitrospiraceae bacterium]